LHCHFHTALRFAAQRLDIVTPSPCNAGVVSMIKCIGGLPPFRNIQHLGVKLIARRFK
jgi:hypothetical protein